MKKRKVINILGIIAAILWAAYELYTAMLISFYLRVTDSAFVLESVLFTTVKIFFLLWVAFTLSKLNKK